MTLPLAPVTLPEAVMHWAACIVPKAVEQSRQAYQMRRWKAARQAISTCYAWKTCRMPAGCARVPEWCCARRRTCWPRLPLPASPLLRAGDLGFPPAAAPAEPACPAKRLEASDSQSMLRASLCRECWDMRISACSAFSGMRKAYKVMLASLGCCLWKHPRKLSHSCTICQQSAVQRGRPGALAAGACAAGVQPGRRPPRTRATPPRAAPAAPRAFRPGSAPRRAPPRHARASRAPHSTEQETLACPDASIKEQPSTTPLRCTPDVCRQAGSVLVMGIGKNCETSIPWRCGPLHRPCMPPGWLLRLCCLRARGH